MGRHYGEMGVESEGVSLSLSSPDLENESNLDITFNPFLLCVCVPEGGDGAPHGSEGRTVKCGPISGPERSSS